MSERARHTDPSTAHAAGDSVTKITDKQMAVWETLRARGPLTDEQLIDAYRAAEKAGRVPAQTDSGIRTRRHELQLMGRAAAAGEGTTRSGRKCIVWDALAYTDWPDAPHVDEGSAGDAPPDALFDAPVADEGPRSAVLGDD